MKKKLKKLRLNKTTISNLNRKEMFNFRGGTTGTVDASDCPTDCVTLDNLATCDGGFPCVNYTRLGLACTVTFPDTCFWACSDYPETVDG